MLRYLYTDIATVEIPDELCLAITVLGCPIHCPDCHSQHVWDIHSQNIGYPLTNEIITNLLKEQDGVSCVLFYGGEWNPKEWLKIAQNVSLSDEMKVALYSGHNLDYIRSNGLLGPLSYVKVGPYDKRFGGLANPKTNQRLYTVENGEIKEDITYRFWR